MLSVKTFTFNPVEENTYVLYNENKPVLHYRPGLLFSGGKGRIKNGH